MLWTNFVRLTWGRFTRIFRFARKGYKFCPVVSEDNYHGNAGYGSKTGYANVSTRVRLSGAGPLSGRRLNMIASVQPGCGRGYGAYFTFGDSEHCEGNGMPGGFWFGGEAFFQTRRSNIMLTNSADDYALLQSFVTVIRLT